MRHIAWLFLILAAGCAPYVNGEYATLVPNVFEDKPDTREYYPETARLMASNLDSQLAARLGFDHTTTRGLQWLVVTTPADLSALGQSTALARAMAEEVASAMTAKGYYVQEIRKTCEVVFNKSQGEFMLSRDVRELATKQFKGTLVLAGTYVAAPKGVRFNLEVIDAKNNDVLAKTSAVVPMSQTVAYLQNQSDDQTGQSGVKASVSTVPGVPDGRPQFSAGPPPDWRTGRMKTPSFLLP